MKGVPLEAVMTLLEDCRAYDEQSTVTVFEGCLFVHASKGKQVLATINFTSNTITKLFFKD